MAEGTACAEDLCETQSKSFRAWAGWGGVGAPKGKVPGRPARTFSTTKDLEHCAKEFGFILCAEGGLGERSDWYSPFSLFVVVMLCQVMANTELGNTEALPVGEIQG